MPRTALDDLRHAFAFTDAHRAEADPSRREAACLRLQVPYVLAPIADGDRIVGGMRHGIVGFSPQHGGVYTYYFHEDRLDAALRDAGGALDAADRARAAALREYWRAQNTHAKVTARFRARFPEARPASYYYNACRVAGLNVDLALLVDLGLDGLKARTAEYRAANGDSPFYASLDAAVDLVADAARRYATEARALAVVAGHAGDAARRAELEETAAVCDAVAGPAPRTFKEGLQLVWLYAVCSDLMNYGRLDDTLGRLYARDLDDGRLDEAEAIRWLASLYRQIARVGKIHDSRVIVGGLGRRDPAAADRLAFAIIRTARVQPDVVPQVTLRYHRDQDPRLMDETLANIAAGAVYPIVYSDEAVVPAVRAIYGVDEAMARRWVPFGCGEYVIEGYGAATPNTGFIPPFLLDLLLHGGRNSFTGRQEIGGDGRIADFATFDDLFAAYDARLREACGWMAAHEELNYRVAGEEAAYLLPSLLLHDCVETGRPAFAGGLRYPAATSEIFGLITAADSLTAIKRHVYDRGDFTLPELVRILDADFAGHDRARHLLLSAPKYGNDDDEADAMAVRLLHHAAEAHETAGRATALYAYKVCSVNNSGSAERGAVLSATACGRRRGTAMSNGNSPSLGADRRGLTATLNSMAKFDPARHVGVVHNIRFEKALLAENRAKIRALLEVFYENGGVQTNLSAVGRDDLRRALAEPEKFPNLIVRIGGFSARFVELSPVIQAELVARTTYEAV